MKTTRMPVEVVSVLLGLSVSIGVAAVEEFYSPLTKGGDGAAHGDYSKTNVSCKGGIRLSPGDRSAYIIYSPDGFPTRDDVDSYDELMVWVSGQDMALLGHQALYAFDNRKSEWRKISSSLPNGARFHYVTDNVADLITDTGFVLVKAQVSADEMYDLCEVLVRAKYQPRDNTPPTKPGMPDLAAEHDTGKSNTDNLTRSTALKFAWSGSTDEGAGLHEYPYEWQLDDGAWQRWTTTDVTLYGVRDGTHTFRVRAKDDASPPNYTEASELPFTVDTVPPTAPTPTAPSGTIGTCTPDVVWNGNGAWRYQVRISVFSTSWWSTLWDSSETASASVAVPEGTLDWEERLRSSSVRACDDAGNWSDYGDRTEFTIHDDIAPTRPGVPDLHSSDDSGLSDDDNVTNRTSGLTITFAPSADGGTGVKGYQIRLDDDEWRDIGLPADHRTDIAAEHGMHTLHLRARDKADPPNYSDASQLTFTVDTEAPPPPELVSPAEWAEIPDPTPRVDWADAEGAWKYQVQVREHDLPLLDRRESRELTVSEWTVPDADGLQPKKWGWQVRAWDIAGNVGPYGASGGADQWKHFTIQPLQVTAFRLNRDSITSEDAMVSKYGFATFDEPFDPNDQDPDSIDCLKFLRVGLWARLKITNALTEEQETSIHVALEDPAGGRHEVSYARDFLWVRKGIWCRVPPQSTRVQHVPIYGSPTVGIWKVFLKLGDHTEFDYTHPAATVRVVDGVINPPSVQRPGHTVVADPNDLGVDHLGELLLQTINTNIEALGLPSYKMAEQAYFAYRSALTRTADARVECDSDARDGRIATTCTLHWANRIVDYYVQGNQIWTSLNADRAEVFVDIDGECEITDSHGGVVLFSNRPNDDGQPRTRLLYTTYGCDKQILPLGISQWSDHRLELAHTADLTITSRVLLELGPTAGAPGRDAAVGDSKYTYARWRQSPESVYWTAVSIKDAQTAVQGISTPDLRLSETELDFGPASTGTRSAVVAIQNGGVETSFGWAVVPGHPEWVTVEPTTGHYPDDVSVAIRADPSTLTPGRHTADVVFARDNADPADEEAISVRIDIPDVDDDPSDAWETFSGPTNTDRWKVTVEEDGKINHNADVLTIVAKVEHGSAPPSRALVATNQEFLRDGDLAEIAVVTLTSMKPQVDRYEPHAGIALTDGEKTVPLIVHRPHGESDGSWRDTEHVVRLVRQADRVDVALDGTAIRTVDVTDLSECRLFCWAVADNLYTSGEQAELVLDWIRLIPSSVPVPAPTITDVMPVTALQGETLKIAVAGTGMLDDLSVSLGDGVAVLAVTRKSSTEAEVTVAVDETAEVGMRSLVITNTDGQEAQLRNALEILPATQTIRGTIHGLNGPPTTVYYHPGDPGLLEWWKWSSVETQPGGHYEITITPGQQSTEVTIRPQETTQPQERSVTVPPDAEGIDFDVVEVEGWACQISFRSGANEFGKLTAVCVASGTPPFVPAPPVPPSDVAYAYLVDRSVSPGISHFQLLGRAGALDPQVGTTHEWRIIVQTPREGPITVDLYPSTDIPEHQPIRLLDLKTGNATDVRKSPTYAFEAAAGEQRELRLVVGTPYASHSLPIHDLQWIFVGLPRTLNTTDIAEIFGADAHFAVWDDSTSSYIAPTRIDERGAGWLWPAKAEAITVPYVPTDGPVAIPMPRGWAMFANPHDIPVSWADCLVAKDGITKSMQDAVSSSGWILDCLFSWGASQYTVHAPAQSVAIDPWTGYWVYVPVDGVTITVPRQPADQARLAARGRPRPLSAIDLQVRCAGTQDSARVVLDTSRASAAIPKPPLSPATGIVLDILDSAGLPSGRLWQDSLRGEAIDLEVYRVGAQRSQAVAELRLADLSAVPREYDAVLEDCATGHTAYMRTRAGYSFTLAENERRKFRLHVAPRSAARLRISNVAIVQSRSGGMQCSYVVSRPAAVAATIRSASGRLVAELASGRASSGTNTLVWRKGRATATLPRGVYLLDLVARTDTGEASRAVRPFSLR